MTIKAKDGDNLSSILNTATDGALVVELPSDCVFRQKVRIERNDLVVIGNGSKIVWDDHNEPVTAPH